MLALVMSALPPKADIFGVGVHVRYVPKADIRVFRQNARSPRSLSIAATRQRSSLQGAMKLILHLDHFGQAHRPSAATTGGSRPGLNRT